MVGKVFKVVFSHRAQRRLYQITDYYRDIASKTVARKVRTSILDAADTLRQLPESKPILPETEGLPFEVRYTKSYAYKVIFRVEKRSATVRVLYISHDAEDPDTIIESL